MAEQHTPRTLDSLAMAYYLTGDPAKAAEAQHQAISLLPAGESDLRAQLEQKLERYLRAAEEAGLDVDLDDPA